MHIDAKVTDLFDVLHILHTRRVTAHFEDDRDLRPQVDVVQSDECTGCTIDKTSEFIRKILRMV